MKNGIGLTDKERLPWLLSLHKLLMEWHVSGKNGVLACSALKQKYRHLLSSGLIYSIDNTEEDKDHESESSYSIHLNLLFILLNCDKSLIEERLLSRHDHDFIKDLGIINSQFEALEIPPLNDCLWTGSTSGKNNKNYLSIEKSYVNNTFYYIYVLKCFRESTVTDVVDNILEFLPKFDNFKLF